MNSEAPNSRRPCSWILDQVQDDGKETRKRHSQPSPPESGMPAFHPLPTLPVPPALLGAASARVTSLKVRELVGERLPEGVAIAGPVDIGLDDRGSGELAQLRNAEDVRHEEVRDGEARSHEPFACPKHVLDMAEALPQPVGEAILRAAGK